MSKFEIKSSQLKNTYEYENEEVKVQGSFEKDATTGDLQSVNGKVYTADSQQAYIGNFNGFMRDGEMKYSISEMSRRDANKVWDAIDDIETHILQQNAD